MSEQIVINVSPRETRVAIVESNVLQDIFVERSSTRNLRGNVYNGRVVRVLPGIESAFVDIGLPRAAFMQLANLPLVSGEDAEKSAPGCRPSPVQEGETVTVQVVKEPFGTKSARVTTSLSFTSRYLVHMPGVDHVGISRKITDEAERRRLKELAESLRNPDEGIVVRTAADGVSEEEFIRDLQLVRSDWCGTLEHGSDKAAPALVYSAPPLFLQVVRDLMRPSTDRVLIDCRHQHGRLVQFVRDFSPGQAEIVELADAGAPLFDQVHIEDQIEQALSRKVLLKSGGHLVIDQTEAMTTIDINTGNFVGRRDLQDTAYRTNLEAAAVIPRQLRLRQIGGIIVLDFIDMMDEEHQRQVLRTLEKGLSVDPVPCQVTEISDLGLVEMTRTRRRESLRDSLCEPCLHCAGLGVVKSAETVCLEIFREMARRARELRDGLCLITASQSVVDRLLDEEAGYLEEVALALGTEVRIDVEPGYSQSQFDVVRLSHQ